MADETVINILCEVASGECVPYDAEPRIVKAVLCERGARAAMASNVLTGMLASAPVVDRASVDKRVWARQAVEWADILLEELGNG